MHPSVVTDHDLRNSGDKKFIQTPVSIQVDSENKVARQMSRRDLKESGAVSNKANLNLESISD